MHATTDDAEGPAGPRAEAEVSVGDEARTLVRLAWPIALAQMGFVCLTLVDTAFVGRVSVVDLAGVSVGRSIGWAAVTLGMGFTLALEPIAAQALGAGEPDRAWSALGASLKCCALSGPLAVGAGVGATFALPLAGVEPGVAARARGFVVGQAPGICAVLAFLSGKTFLQAHQRTRPTLLASLIANALNVAACAVLVPRLGALGAGISSSVATVGMAAVVLAAARAHRTAPPRDPVPVAMLVRLGVPVGLQLFSEVGVFTAVAVLAARLGAVVAAAHNIALALASGTFMAALGVADATAVRVGHAVGAGRSPRRVGLVGIGLGAAFMTLGTALFALLPEPLARLFTEDARVVELGRELIAIAALFQLFDGIQCVSAGALRGAGDVRAPFVFVTACHWLVGLPVAVTLAFARGDGARGLWWGLTAGLVTVAIALASRFAWLSRAPIRRV
jgi:MATE family multidrug resistance protein